MAHEDHGSQTVTSTGNYTLITTEHSGLEIALKYRALEPKEETQARLFVTKSSTNEPVILPPPSITVKSGGYTRTITATTDTTPGIYNLAIPPLTEGVYELQVQISGQTSHTFSLGSLEVENAIYDGTGYLPLLLVTSLILALIMALILYKVLRSRRVEERESLTESAPLHRAILILTLYTFACGVSYSQTQPPPPPPPDKQSEEAPPPAITEYSGTYDAGKTTKFIPSLLNLSSAPFIDQAGLSYPQLVDLAVKRAVVQEPKVRDRRKSKSSTTDEAAVALNEKRRTLTSLIMNSYSKAVTAGKLLDSIKYLIEINEILINDTHSKLRGGEAAPIELNVLELHTDRLRAKAVRLRADLEAEVITLTGLTGQSVQLAPLPDTIPDIDHTIEDLTAIALKNAPKSTEQLEITQDQIRRQVTISYKRSRAILDALLLYEDRIVPRATENARNIHSAHNVEEFYNMFTLVDEQQRLVDVLTSRSDIYREALLSLYSLEQEVGAQLVSFSENRKDSASTGKQEPAR
jgi:hypothetical protein